MHGGIAGQSHRGIVGQSRRIQFREPLLQKHVIHGPKSYRPLKVTPWAVQAEFCTIWRNTEALKLSLRLSAKILKTMYVLKVYFASSYSGSYSQIWHEEVFSQKILNKRTVVFSGNYVYERKSWTFWLDAFVTYILSDKRNTTTKIKLVLFKQ